MSEFDRVDKGRSGRYQRDGPQLAIYPDGSGRINAAADRRWFDDTDAVEFYVDAEGRALGLARCSEPGDHAYAATRSGGRPGRDVALTNVLAHLGIAADDLDETVYVRLEHNPREGLLVGDLDALFDAVGGDAT